MECGVSAGVCPRLERGGRFFCQNITNKPTHGKYRSKATRHEDGIKRITQVTNDPSHKYICRYDTQTDCRTKYETFATGYAIGDAGQPQDTIADTCGTHGKKGSTNDDPDYRKKRKRVSLTKPGEFPIIKIEKLCEKIDAQELIRACHTLVERPERCHEKQQAIQRNPRHDAPCEYLSQFAADCFVGRFLRCRLGLFGFFGHGECVGNQVALVAKVRSVVRVLKGHNVHNPQRKPIVSTQLFLYCLA